MDARICRKPLVVVMLTAGGLQIWGHREPGRIVGYVCRLRHPEPKGLQQ